MNVVNSVKSVLVDTLGIEDRADSMTAETELLGSLPELDSLAVLEVIVALEAHFSITFDDDDVSSELFETLGSLATLVDGKLI